MESATLLLQLVLSLGGVLGLIWLLARTAQKRGWMSGGTNAHKPIRVVARHGLTKTTSLAVVQVGDRELLLGVGAQGVSVLLEDEAGALLALPDTASLGRRARARALTAAPSASPALVTEGSVTTSGFAPSSARTPMLDRLRARTVRH
jgi:flagellar biogenesis protein FliO